MCSPCLSWNDSKNHPQRPGDERPTLEPCPGSRPRPPAPGPGPLSTPAHEAFTHVHRDARTRHWEQQRYRYGFVTDLDADTFPLNEDVIRRSPRRRKSPSGCSMAPQGLPRVAEDGGADRPKVEYPRSTTWRPYSRPRRTPKYDSIDQVDPKLLETYDRLGSRSRSRALAGVAVDAVFDSVSVATTFKEELAKAGVIFCSISEAAREHPTLAGISARPCRRATTTLRR